jgi:hypothetical protein
VSSEHASNVPLIPTWSDPLVTRAVDATVGTAAERLARYEAQHRRVGLGAIGAVCDIRCCPSQCHTAEVLHLSGRLVGSGARLIRFTRVDIEISAVSPGTLELRMLPRSLHIHGWGRRRQRRYFRLAHAAADHPQQVLTGDAQLQTVRPPLAQRGSSAAPNSCSVTC